MSPSHSSVEVTKKIQSILAPLVPDDLKAIYYGDTELVPEYPAVILESGPKVRGLDGSASTRHWQVTLSTEIVILHAKVQDASVTKEEVETLAELVEDTINASLTLDGLVIYGVVTRVEPGFARKQQIMLRASRLTWEGLSRQTF